MYDAPAAADGHRVLVDRMWPRGLRKSEVSMDEWLKDVAPSTELRKWFGHEPERFEEFERRYRDELAGSEALDRLRAICRDHSVVTLLYGAKDEEHNQAEVLRRVLAD